MTEVSGDEGRLTRKDKHEREERLTMCWLFGRVETLRWMKRVVLKKRCLRGAAHVASMTLFRCEIA